MTLSWSYDPAALPEGVAEEDLVIVYYDADAGTWVELDSVVDTANNEITAFVSHFTTFAILAYAPPAVFTSSALTISPTEVDIGQSVTIGVTVANTGGVSGSYEVTLKIDNVVVDTKYVTLDGGASQKVTFTATKDAAGTYTVTVDGLSGTFTVKAPIVPVKPGPNWWLIGGIIAAVIIIGGLLVLWWRRRTD